jgi:class 3 adenylate cyclase
MSEAVLLFHTLLSPRLSVAPDALGDLTRWAVFVGAFALVLSAVVAGTASRIGLWRRPTRVLPGSARKLVRDSHELLAWNGLDTSEWGGSAPVSEHTLNAAVMFTDVVGFSAAMDRDEDATLRGLAGDLHLIHGACRAHGGRVLKTVGDGVLAVFEDAVGAVGCAQSIQRLLAARPLGSRSGLHHRIGIHAGHVFRFSGEVMGATVNVAARLEKEAPAGGICVSQSVVDACGGVLPEAVFQGEKSLRNISGVFPLYVLRPSLPPLNVLPFPDRISIFTPHRDVVHHAGVGPA